MILSLPVSWVMFLLCTTGGPEHMTDRAAGSLHSLHALSGTVNYFCPVL
ncbi:hypothetical protein CLOBOL_03809 [Enterocloster bolteae ATCC BAA-613]|uniref:Uncharacterized protein n=1 Tax=Enterocloster bolteae (strain ATCC BAA-613 / DSM 15670 / CCUG 46953 / JCM 12243 / WAL 16351) TaxID=411902 RepID=A8RTW0_ENTBW|nr:hypothetical protein CLOBOL_03809 [Enterocloster bolteae ATCC BAA-613]